MSAPFNVASWVQPTAAGALNHDAANDNPVAPTGPSVQAAIRVSVELSSTAKKSATVGPPLGDLRLLGPGDVCGVDAEQILRRFPAPGSAGTNTTHLAFIDFAATDLPWRFSPATGIAAVASRLRPWLVLIAVTADNQVSTDGAGSWITLPTNQLPDLAQSWSWAHAQLDDPTQPGTGRSRLLCPRQLPSGTPMRAVLVPAFAAGNAAAPPSSDHYEPAWPSPATSATVTLRVYDHWTFTTGDGLDFETLAERITPLRPGQISGFGAPEVDVTNPLPGSVTPLSSALRTVPVDTALAPLRPEPLDAAQQALLGASAQQLVGYLNECVDNRELCPPVRGRYHVGHADLDATAATWLDQANRDPRRRLAAGHGADWVNANQEDLMAQAWQQAGQVREAARQLATARAALAIADSLHRRHVQPLSVDQAVRLKAPAAGQLPAAAGTLAHGVTQPSPLADVLAASSAPQGLGSNRFARLATTLAATTAAGTGVSLTSKAMTGGLLGMRGVNTVTPTAAPSPAPVAPDAAAPSTQQWGGTILVGPDLADQTSTYLVQRSLLVSEVQAALSGLPSTTTAGITRTLVTAGGVRQQKTIPVSSPPHSMAAAPQLGLAALNISRAATAAVWASTPSPSNEVAARVVQRWTTASGNSPVRVTPAGPVAIRPAATHGDPRLVSNLQLALPTPRVGAPLALALLEQDPNWLIAGATDFPADTATLLAPNAAVIEAILLGANYAMLDEYLWRGFPTDRRGTPIRRFWPRADPDSFDIDPIDTWVNDSPLGSHLAGGSAGLVVLMVRSELFPRYPDLVIGAVPATMTDGAPTPKAGAPLMAPAFPMIAVDDRTRIIGFDTMPLDSLPAVPSSSEPGWYFVFVEPPTGLRFGFETREWPGGPTNPFVNTPGTPNFPTSAALAEAARQLPVRVFLHSSQMVGDGNG